MSPANRLAAETSPYLLQHAHNPVDWYPWGEAAFALARAEDRPVFLSIGYSSCHWCHVMERESFEDEATARLLNDLFVSIKVDREERPDVDDVYMSAVQAMGNRGGWPLSAFLLPDGRPFFGGTYFPPDGRGGRPGFGSLLVRIAEAYRDRRGELEKSAAQLAAALGSEARVAAEVGPRPLVPELLEGLTSALHRGFDTRHGGFGGAPKFPPHQALDWLLLVAGRGGPAGVSAAGMADATLEAMALGGIHDHVGGGFHRYSTDERWLLPHFEKMLTDNALLLGLYARAHARSGRALFGRTARGIGDYLLSEMRGAEGGFYAGTDADSEGEEGRYFVWSAEEIREVLGADASLVETLYGVRPEGNFRDEATGEPTGRNILHLRKEPTPEEEARLAPLRRKLKEVRARRVSPALDDKRVAGWNALAVSGLAVAAGALGEPRYLDAARTGARFLLQTARDGSGRLLRSWKDGRGSIAGFLEDEAFLANALLDLATATAGDEARDWLAEARPSVEAIRTRFKNPSGPGFLSSGEGNETLLVNGRDLFDKAIPSASAAACRALVRAARLTGEPLLADEARAAVEEVSGLMERAPHGTETWYLVADLLLGGEGPERAAGELPAPKSEAAGMEGFDGDGCEGGVCAPRRPQVPPRGDASGGGER